MKDDRQTLAITTDDSAAEEAFSAVYDAYLPLLRKVAMRKFHIPATDVDALVHDVFTTYLAHRERVRELHPYLIGGICNAAREYWRKAHRDRVALVDGGSHTAAMEAPLLESIVQNLLVQSALSQLGTSCRDALRRFYVDGENAATIAASRQTTPNSIHRLLHYCRERARAAYIALNEDKQDRGTPE